MSYAKLMLLLMMMLILGLVLSIGSAEQVTERAGSVDRDGSVTGPKDEFGADAVDATAGTLSKAFHAPDSATFRDFTDDEKINQAPESKIDLILSEGWAKDGVSESETTIGVNLTTNDFDSANAFPILADGNLSKGGGSEGGQSPHWAAIVGAHGLHVEWVEHGSALTENPNPGGGMRIFPCKLTPSDTEDRNKVKVRVTLVPAAEDTTIYFGSFDVDDPYTDDAPIDPNGAAGNDNRGSPQAGILSVTSAVTDEYGVAEIEFEVTMQPGDNFRVAASLHQDELTKLQVTSPGNDFFVPSGNAPGIDNFDGAITPMLTVWRRVHIELDSMAAVQDNSESGNLVRVVGTEVCNTPQKLGARLRWIRSRTGVESDGAETTAILG